MPLNHRVTPGGNHPAMQPESGLSSAAARLGVGGNRHLAASLQTVQESSLGGNGHGGHRVVDHLPNRGRNRRVCGPHRHRERALSRRREHELGWKPLPDSVPQVKPYQAGGGQHNGGPLGVRVELGQAGTYVATEVGHEEIGTGVQQLSTTAQAAGSDHATLRNVAPAKRCAADQGIAGILSGAYGSYRDPIGKLSREVLERVHREVDPSLEQRIVDLLGKDRATADSSERDLCSQITGRFDLNGHGLVTSRTEQGPDPLGLP